MATGIVFLLAGVAAAAWAATQPHEPLEFKETFQAPLSHVRIETEPTGPADRVSFAWADPVQYRVSRVHPQAVVVEFDHNAIPRLPPIARTVTPHLELMRSENEQGRLTMVIGTAPGTDIAYHHEGNTVMLDVFPAKERQQMAAYWPKGDEAERTQLAMAEDAGFRGQDSENGIAFTAGNRQIAAPVAPVMITTVAEEVPEGAVQSETAADAIAKATSGEPSAQPPMEVQIAHSSEALSLTFPWQEKVNAAVFERAGAVWMVFDQPASIAMSSLGAVGGSWGVEQLPHSGSTVLRLTVPEGYHPHRVSKTGNDWVVELGKGYRPPGHSTPVERKAGDEKEVAHLWLPVTDYTSPITITDPAVGDQIDVIPLPESGQGLFPAHRYVDVELLTSHQGVVVHGLSDRLSMKLRHAGVMLTAEKGLQLSTEVPELTPPAEAPHTDETTAAPAESAPTPPGTLPRYRWLEKPSKFAYAYWRGDLAPSFLKQRETLQAALATEIDDTKRFTHRLSLIRFLLAEGLYREARVELRTAQADPQVATRIQAIAMYEAIANAEGERYAEALTALEKVGMAEDPEISLWKRALAAAAGTGTEPVKLLDSWDAYIRQYPPIWREMLGRIAARQAVNLGAGDSAEALIATLLQDPEMSSNGVKELTYLRGKAAELRGDREAAFAYFKPLLEDFTERKYRARAQLAYIRMLREDGKLPDDKALDMLDRLRSVWRGDLHEAEVLQDYGMIAIAQGKHKDGFNAWRTLVTTFGKEPIGTETAQAMTSSFIDLFNKGGADALSPLEALSLYYEFRELTPVGEEGDLMIENLADRLAAIDLLDRAAALLTHQITYRLEGMRKAQAGGRVALLHLLNEKPEDARSILLSTDMPDLPAELAETRRHLLAKSLLELNKYDDALALLTGDTSESGNLLLVDILWKKGDWKAITTHLETLLAGKESGKEPLTKRESEQVLRLGLAHVFAGDNNALSALKTRFTARMKGNEYEKAFAFITRDDPNIDHTNFDQINGEIGAFEGFLTDFKTKVEKGKLSKTVK